MLIHRLGTSVVVDFDQPLALFQTRSPRVLYQDIPVPKDSPSSFLSSLCFSFVNYRLEINLPTGVQLIDLLTSIERHEEARARKQDLCKALFDLSEHLGLKNDPFVKDLELEEFIFYWHCPLIRETHNIVVVTTKLLAYLQGQISTPEFLYKSLRQHIEDFYGSVPVTLFNAAKGHLYAGQTQRRVIVRDQNTCMAFENKFQQQGDQRYLISRTDLSNENEFRVDFLFYNEMLININVINFLKITKGLYPIEVLAKVLNDKKGKQTLAGSLDTRCADLIKLMSPKRRLIILDYMFTAAYLLFDSARQYFEFNTPESIPGVLKHKYPNGIDIPKKFKNMTELHDPISKAYNEITAEKETLPIEYTEEELKLEVSSEKIDIRLPRETKEIVHYGLELKHCVASYADRAREKKCLILGIYVKGELKYNARLNKDTLVFYKIDELRGFKNCSPLPEDMEDIRALLSPFLVEKTNSEIMYNHELIAGGIPLGGIQQNA